MLADTKVQVPDAFTSTGTGRILAEVSGRPSAEETIAITAVDGAGKMVIVGVRPQDANLIGLFLIDAARTIEARAV